MELNKSHGIGIGIGLALIALAFLLRATRYFFFLLGLGVLIGFSPFVFSLIQESKKESDKEEMFLEFSRNLVESVKSGNPINKSILNVKSKSYGPLSPHVRKLANQISIGIPLRHALQTFSKDVKNKTISRALTLIGQAERAGGNIGNILESVAESVSTSEKLKKERKSTISTLVVQGYIIFLVFLVIILVMQFRILPIVAGISTSGAGIGGVFGGVSGSAIDPQELSNAFLYLLLVQGLFSGLTIGKLAEGSIKAGVKHSFALMLISFLVSSGANVIFGG
jgi:flagellar protein FlaJ